ncbi:MAG: GNAT family N-acetyltransferase [Candidatus Rokubacteria bacterium]|nr:GNAT family N-acetyltransferase [Candidatus Rokubacteria bacterium]
MQQFSWARACAETFASDGELQVVVVGEPRPTAIAPLVRRGRLGRLELLGVRELHEPMDFLYADVFALEQLARALAGLGSPIFLRRIPADSPVVSAMRNAYDGRGIVICRPVGGCPWIPLDGSWTEPERHLNSSRRSALRRAERIAQTMGEVSYEVLSPNPLEVKSLLAETFRIEAASWKGRAGSALLCDAARGFFYLRYGAAACQKGILRLCFMRIGGRAAGMQIAVETGQSFWLLKIGYVDEFARCSPGMLLLRETIRHAAARGLRSYEFLGAVEPWTRVWTERVRECVSLRAYHHTMQGSAALVVDVAEAGVRRLVSKNGKSG